MWLILSARSNQRRGTNLYSNSVRYFSASKAAIQPEPAEVIACLYLESWTSPAAKTPGMLVKEEPGMELEHVSFI